MPYGALDPMEPASRYLVKLILFLESYLTHCYLVSGDFPPPVESTTTT